jgi:hypothetical protein
MVLFLPQQCQLPSPTSNRARAPPCPPARQDLRVSARHAVGRPGVIVHDLLPEWRLPVYTSNVVYALARGMPPQSRSIRLLVCALRGSILRPGSPIVFGVRLGASALGFRRRERPPAQAGPIPAMGSPACSSARGEGEPARVGSRERQTTGNTPGRRPCCQSKRQPPGWPIWPHPGSLCLASRWVLDPGLPDLAGGGEDDGPPIARGWRAKLNCRQTRVVKNNPARQEVWGGVVAGRSGKHAQD